MTDEKDDISIIEIGCDILALIGWTVMRVTHFVTTLKTIASDLNL